ncbi:spore germination lipoprotein GerD [Virgibacillus sp. MG-45]|uniref:spore germination lipoprotein GerD n=1 Tax=Virgibacillus sp. MG-45 TaxID=3102791 RepID=UPI002EDAD00E
MFPRSRFILFSIVIMIMTLLSACSGENPAAKEGEYDTTKKMVVDILQTEEGKKALAEIMADEKMKQELIMDAEVVKKSINEALTSEKGKEMWEKLFKDPKFVKDFAKSMEDSHKKLMKDLLKDPEYQKQMIDLMKNPEVEKQMLDVLKSQQFKAHLEESIQQTFDSPLFQAKIQEILLKAAEKQGSQQQGGQGQGGGGEQQGGSGGGG